MGWFITVLGLVLIMIGGFFTYYGQHILNKKADVSPEQISSSKHILGPLEEKLLRKIFTYQSELGLNKLIIGRDGLLYLEDENKRKKYQINILMEVYDIEANNKVHEVQFENLILGIPDTYLRSIPEMRIGSPYVVQITEEGISYLKNIK